MKYATKVELLAQTAVRYRDVPIREVGLVFRIRSLTELEKSRYEMAPRSRGDLDRAQVLNAKRRLVALCLVDGEGNRILSDADVEQLRSIDGLVISRLFDACWDHCGFSKDDTVEDLVKNSAAIRADDSPSDSPDTSATPGT